MDAADFQGVGQGGDGLGVRFEVIEQLQGHANLVRSRPFQQLSPVDAVLPPDLVRGQAPLFDPACNRGLGHFEQFGEIPNTKLHVAPRLPMMANHPHAPGHQLRLLFHSFWILPKLSFLFEPFETETG